MMNTNMTKAFYINMILATIGLLYLLFGPRQLCKYSDPHIAGLIVSINSNGAF